MKKKGYSMAVSAVKSAALALAGAALVTGAWAQQAYFSGPSMVRLQQAATFKGKGFAPNQAFNVAQESPAGTSVAGVVSAADGALSYTLVPVVAGAYTLRVTDNAGQTLAKATLAVLP